MNATGNKKYYYPFQIMSFPFFLRTDELRGPTSLLQAAECRLGPLTAWPSDILNILFFDLTTFQMLLRLVNFFYWNRVPCSLVIQLIRTCKDDLMTGVISTLYEGVQQVFK